MTKFENTISLHIVLFWYKNIRKGDETWKELIPSEKQVVAELFWKEQLG